MCSQYNRHTCHASSSCDSSSLRWMASSNWLFRDIISFLLLTNSTSIRFFLWRVTEQLNIRESVFLKLTFIIGQDSRRKKNQAVLNFEIKQEAASYLAMASSRSLMACWTTSPCSSTSCSLCLSCVFSCCSCVFWRCRRRRETWEA